MSTTFPRRRTALRQWPRLGEGFTLTELAVALAILSLMVGGLLLPLASHEDLRRADETRRGLQESHDALLGFAVTHGYLPCPAAPNSAGQEAGGRTLGLCNSRAGLLPWSTLGTRKLDGWGREFRYSVTKAFTDNSTQPQPYFLLTANGDIVVRGEGGVALTTSGTVVAAVLSHGPNGAGAITDTGATIANTSVTNLDEQENAGILGTGTTFHDRIRTDRTTISGGEIDDMAIFLPNYLLKSRLVAARRLPHP